MTPASLTEVRLRVSDDTNVMALFGERDLFLRVVEEAFPDARIVARGNEVAITAEPGTASRVGTVFQELQVLIGGGIDLDVDRVRRVISLVQSDVESPSRVFAEGVVVGRGKVVRAKTFNQRAYLDAIRDGTMIFAIGPAGTGKTYLAMAVAVEALTGGAVSRIILTRPAVEAGERLGFLPGDLAAKVDPYLRPLYDALYEMLGPEDTQRRLAQGSIEIAPLAYMRGRTLNDAFIVLDEAQNTSPEQMKMFLTRLGFNSKMVVTGDVTQVDLPSGAASGLQQARVALESIAGVRMVELTSKDVVRHRIVAAIVDAYRRFEERGRV